jgi:hypothetical protein
MNQNVRKNGVVIVSYNVQSETYSLPGKSPTFYITNQFCRVRYIERLLYIFLSLINTIVQNDPIFVNQKIVRFLLKFINKKIKSNSFEYSFERWDPHQEICAVGRLINTSVFAEFKVKHEICPE